MNLVKTLTICILTLPVLLKAQTHPTINSIGISYMSALNDQVTPEVTVNVKNWENVSKIYLKIKDLSNNQKYEVFYTITDLPILDLNEKNICFKKDLFLQLLANISLPLQAYIYEIQTENAQGNISPSYTHTEELEP